MRDNEFVCYVKREIPVNLLFLMDLGRGHGSLTEKKQILKSASIISLVTIVSRVLGYVRDQRIALLLGTTRCGGCLPSGVSHSQLVSATGGRRLDDGVVHSGVFQLHEGEGPRRRFGILPTSCSGRWRWWWRRLPCWEWCSLRM